MDIDYIDIGVNLLDESFKKDLDEVLDRAFSANVCVLINTSSSIEDAKRSLDLHGKTCWAYRRFPTLGNQEVH